MVETSEDLKVKTATNCAQNFIETFYSSLNNPKGRSAISSFYVKPNSASPAKPVITINGNIISSPAQFQKLFETQIQRAHYEVQSYDAHVMNSNHGINQQNSSLPQCKIGKRTSVVILISGSVKYWKEGEDGNVRGFTETIVLVPNREAYESNSTTKETMRKWLISSQTFRLVV
ncbi:hypothetical protein K3495_g6602 [Podosphaera aphanis]|nr:hypothetical protein K3495_g6602 [Podosphaera aphanis]